MLLEKRPAPAARDCSICARSSTTHATPTGRTQTPARGRTAEPSANTARNKTRTPADRAEWKSPAACWFRPNGGPAAAHAPIAECRCRQPGRRLRPQAPRATDTPSESAGPDGPAPLRSRCGFQSPAGEPRIAQAVARPRSRTPAASTDHNRPSAAARHWKTAAAAPILHARLAPPKSFRTWLASRRTIGRAAGTLPSLA